MGKEIELHVESGTLLAAGPDMLDPNFMHTVVLICQHTAEGAYGLIVNRPSGHTTRTLFAEHALWKELDFPIYIGGPVALVRPEILHRAPDAIPGGVPILESIWLGGDADAAERYVRENRGEAEDSLRLLLGYSGWGAGQLDHELATGSWLPVAGLPEHVFARDSSHLWRNVMRSLGRDAQGLEVQPPDPRWN